jgi:hypothetical protein
MRVAPFAALVLFAGCSNQKMASVADYEAPTYYGDVEPVLHQRCARCHQPLQLAPFSMRSVQEVLAHKREIADSLAQHTMPPMPATDEEDCPPIDDPRVMPEAERALVLSWIAAGAPLGEARAESPLPSPYGPLGPATNRYPMTTRYVAPTAATHDDYRCFVIDPALTSVLPITAMSVEPGNPTIVHHATVYSVPPSAVAAVRALESADDAPGYDCFGGVGVAEAYASGAWVPGMTPVPPPRPGLGAWLFPGWVLVMQVHYNFDHGQSAPGESLGDQSQVLVWRAAQPVTEVPAALVLGDWTFDLPAGQRVQHSVEGAVLPTGQTAAVGQVTEGLIYEAWGHEHLLGTSFRMDLVHPDGSSACLLHIPRWDFHWQGLYPLATPVAAHAGDRVRVTCEWDNTTSHDVHYGETTADEMCLGTLAVMHFPR